MRIHNNGMGLATSTELRSSLDCSPLRVAVARLDIGRATLDTP